MEQHSYTIFLSGDYITVSRTEYKDESGLKDCQRATGKWDVSGDETVDGFFLGDGGCVLCFNVKVVDAQGAVVFETDVKESDVGNENGILRIEEKGNCFDESEEAIKGKCFYYSGDDWYSGWQWKGDLKLEAPFDPKKLSLFCHYFIATKGCKNKFIGLRSIQYDGLSLAKSATSVEERPIGGDDEMFSWALVDGVRKWLDIDYGVE